MDAERMLCSMLGELPDGYEVVAKSLLHAVIDDAKCKTMQLLYGVDVHDWVAVLEGYGVRDIDKLRAILEESNNGK